MSCRCTPAASPQKTLPAEVTDTPRASDPMELEEFPPGRTKWSTQDDEPHWLHACAPPAVKPLLEIEVGGRPALDGSVVMVEPTFSLTAPLCSPQ
jgi:hypothetical protein